MKTEQAHNNEQWKKMRFDQFFDMLPTNTLSRDKLNNQRGEYQNIHYGDVLIKYPCCLDCNVNDIPYINEGVRFNTAQVKNGDVIFADTAEDDTVGKCVEVLNVGDRKIVSGLHTYFCRPKHEMAHGYLGYFLNSNHFHNQLLPYIAGSKVSSVNRTSIARTFIFYPESLPAQRRIAAILSSADKVIESTRRLIEKYKKMKQGMMEDLLKPKEGWKMVKLGEVGEINPSNKEPIPNQFIYIDLECVVAGKLLVENSIVKRNAPSRAQRLVYNNDVLYQTVRPYQRNNYIHKKQGNYVASTGYALIRCCDDYEPDFVYYLLHTHNFESVVLGLCTGTSYPAIAPNNLKRVEITVPFKNGKPNIVEQRRISTILSGIDAKIAAEEKVLEKYEKVKKGMMERMLNGENNLN